MSVLPSSLAEDDDDFDVAIGEDARVAANGAGEAVIVWEGDDADESGIFARVFDREGSAQGAPFQVNVTSVDEQDQGDAVWLSPQTFAVVWRSETATTDVVRSRLFSRDGTSLATEFQINTAPSVAEQPVVGADAQGRFVVVWGGNGDLFHRRFSIEGEALGSEQQFAILNTATTPAVGVAPNGEFLVAWRSLGDIFAQRFDPAGSPRGAEFVVNQTTTGDQAFPAVTPTSDGAFLIAWQSDAQDGSGSGIFNRRVEHLPVGAEMQINTHTTDDQALPSIGIDQDGTILVTWQSEGGQDGQSAGIFGSYLRPTGRPICPDLRINTRVADAQRSSSVAGGVRQFFVAWQTELNVPVPGEPPTLQARRISSPILVDDFESGDASAWSSAVF